MIASRPTLVSEEEFLALPESMDRIELLDGEVILSPTPSVWHQELLSRLELILRLWAKDYVGSLFIGRSPLDVRFGPGRILQPDAFIILAELSLHTKGPIERVPDICIEVLSGNRVYDRVTKRYVYAEAGVRELWLLEPSGSIVERRSGPGLEQVEELRATLTTPLLPGLVIDLEALFRRS